MKIPLGGGYLEPDEGPRDTPHHKRIAMIEAIPNTRAGNRVTLECGHTVQTFGDLSHAGGVALCAVCRDADMRQSVLVCQHLAVSVSVEAVAACSMCGAEVAVSASSRPLLEQYRMPIVCHTCWRTNFADCPTMEAPGARAETEQIRRRAAKGESN